MPQAALAQDTSADNHDSEKLRGTVINKVTHEPISRALVYSPDNRLAAMTDSEGYFEFAVPKSEAEGGRGSATFVFSGQPGFFSLAAKKPGFLQDPEGTDPVARGNDITISLFPEAIIRGRVLITNAEPAVGMNVQLFTRQVQDGMPRWMPSTMTRTNSLGEFRFAELLPGAYKVMTQELMDTDPETIAPRGPQYGFPPVCFPGVPDFASGNTIQLAAGQKFQADIPLARQRYFPVNVPVVNAENIQGMNVSVSAQAHPGPGYSLGYNPGTHRIEGLLPGGHYLVEGHVYGPIEASGEVSVAITGAEVQQPTMVLIPGIQIPVNVREDFTSNDWNGFTSFSDGKHTYQLHGPRVYLQIMMESVDEFSQQGIRSFRPPKPNDESLVIENVSPGRYWVRIQSGRGYAQSVSSGGVDLLHEPLVVTSGSQSPIEVVMRDDDAEIEGTVTGVNAVAGHGGTGPYNGPQPGDFATSVFIYCVPLPDSSGQFAQFGAAPDGTFHSPGLAPGSYRVLAFARQPPRMNFPVLFNLPYRDPQAMRAYENQGQVVRLVAGQKEHLQLQLSSGE